jgi:phosphohistidine swiveling domain-containing protein
MADPLHEPGTSWGHWTTDNVGEALPGVATPLGWTMWKYASDRMCRDLSYDLGVFDRREQQGPAPGEPPIISIFFGRIAMSIEWLGTVGDHMPGTSGRQAVTDMLGRVPETMTFDPTRRRWPVIAYRLPLAAIRTPKQLRAQAPVVEAWWREQVAALPRADEATARMALEEAAQRFLQTMTVHGVGLFAAVTPLIKVVNALVDEAGVGNVGQLSGSGGAEMTIVEDIWRASRGELPVDEVAGRHGYHGPLEGEISSRVWREDPAPLKRMIEVYAQRDDSEDPVSRDANARERLPQLQQEVVAALPLWQRPVAARLLRHAAKTIPLRGVGKASFLQALDVARAAARRLGVLMAEDGRLADPDDVFYLTLDELTKVAPSDPQAAVAERRGTRERYEAMRLPASWRGVPEPELGPAAQGDATVSGVGASAGTVEGIVRVVRNPDFVDVEEGEVLVSHTTDPSWASIMFVSTALVTDIGGMISHAAVVARELDIPCVVNTRNATDVLRDGDRVSVDGERGTVTILERATVPAVPQSSQDGDA